MKIIAKRGLGNIVAAPIIEPLLGSKQAMAQRARNAIDESNAGAIELDADCKYLGGSNVGDIVAFIDYVAGIRLIGKLTLIQHARKGVEIFSKVRVKFV